MRRRRDPSSSLEEPLLGADSSEDGSIEIKPKRDGTTPLSSPTNSIEREQSNAAWREVFTGFLLNWAGFLRHLLLGGQSMVAAILDAVTSLSAVPKPKTVPALEILPPIELSPVTEERLRKLQGKLGVAYDDSLPEHREALDSLWNAVYPGRERTKETEAAGWKDMGWQGNHPASDFRGGGLLSLENLIYFAKTYPKSFRSLMLKQEGRRAEWEYPFAAAGVNLTVVLSDMLDLRASLPGTSAGRTFLRLLEDDENAFEELYCVFFEALDAKWLETKASYMEFNVVLKATQKYFEEALRNLQSIRDLPNHAQLSA